MVVIALAVIVKYGRIQIFDGNDISKNVYTDQEVSSFL